MPNQRLTTAWTNLNTSIPLVDGSSYRFMNIGGDKFTLIEAAVEPAANDIGFIYEVLESKLESFTVQAGLTWWARGVYEDTLITINEAI